MKSDETQRQMDLKESVRSMMRKRGVSAKQIAERLGCSESSVNIQLGKNPSIAWLLKLADAIGCTIGDLLPKEQKTKQDKSIVQGIIWCDGKYYHPSTADDLRRIADEIG